jgi:hypothetical protein
MSEFITSNKKESIPSKKVVADNAQKADAKAVNIKGSQSGSKTKADN